MILLIPTAILLAISFFVLVTVAKVEAKSLKIFGWVTCVFLWLVAASILSTAFTAIAPGLGSPYNCIGTCAMKGHSARDWRTDPHHAWMNNPHSKSMLDDPQTNMMMDSSDTPGTTMGGMMSDKKMKCPGTSGMGNMKGMGDMPEKK
jgi:hypothetical protein